MLAGIDHVALEVKDLGRAERFYTQILGLSVVMRLPDQVLLRCGAQNLAVFLKIEKPELSEEEKLRLVNQPLGKAHISFRASWESYQQFKSAVEAEGIPHHEPINWGDHEGYYFLDPDGNLLEIAGYKPPKSPEDLKTTIALRSEPL